MIIGIITATLRTTTPLVFAGIGGVFSERAGVVNIGLEGMMVMGAFFAVLGTYLTGSPLVGILFSIIAGALIGLLHAFLSISLKAEQVISGTATGLGGAALIGITPVYREGMVAGRGFIALAAMIFGNWKPFGTMWACLLFAFGGSFEIFAQGFSWNLPSEFYSSIPYILTMLALAGFVGKTTAPAADGQPYEKNST